MNDLKKEAIAKAFARASLEVKFAAKPPLFARASKKVFFCSIGRKGKKAWYEIWPGDDENRIEVLDANKDFKQVVLMVHEPARLFKVREYSREKHKMVIREQKVSADKRKFLIGYDERDLFMAQLPASTKATTVVDAHRALFNPSVTGKHQRQGEWFFVPLDSFQAAELNGKLVSVLYKTPLSRQGKPHRCDELVRYRSQELSGPDIVYARGRVTHPDHATIILNGWHRVYPNTENRGTNSRWID